MSAEAGLAGVLAAARSKGVRLWWHNGEVRYEGPKGALTHEERRILRESREQLIALLNDAPRTKAHLQRAPLSFSQVMHWNWYRLGECCVPRRVACATRLHSPLDLGALRMSIAEAVRVQGALRTRIVVVDGMPMQEVAESGILELAVSDLSDHSHQEREARLQLVIETEVLKLIDVCVDPLVCIHLVKLTHSEYVVIVAMEHLISDGVSLGILLRDLLVAYAQYVREGHCRLSSPEIQFADYAAWQRSAHSTWLRKHWNYWSGHLAGCRRLSLPSDSDLSMRNHEDWGHVPLRIDSELAAKLRCQCRLRRTTLPLSVLTAYVALLIVLCGTTDIVVQYATDGRKNSRVERTIGFFAYTLPLRIQIAADDTVAQLLRRVVDEYCSAQEHADYGYIRSQVPPPEFTRNGSFNWSPSTLGAEYSTSVSATAEIVASTIDIDRILLKNFNRDSEPVVSFRESDAEIIGSVYYPRNRFQHDTMERFGRNLILLSQVILGEPEKRVQDLSLL